MNRCRHYAIKGFCQMGDTCSFSHDGTPGDMTPQQFLQQGGRLKENSYSAYNSEVATQPTAAPRPAVQGRPKIVCRHFARGFCQLGDRCGFVHGQDGQNNGNSAGANKVPSPAPEVVEKAKAAAENAAKLISEQLGPKKAQPQPAEEEKA